MEPREENQPSGRFLLLSLAALGIVFGDIGTSPLYAMREAFAEHFGIEPTTANVLGILSLITWALLIIVTLKYVLLVLRVDNEGQGGVLALASLLQGKAAPTGQQQASRRNRFLLVSVGLFGAALLYGDGILTPAISVLSAVEGLEIAAPAVSKYVVPITVTILFALFLIQRRGTEKVGALFGPITLVWFTVLGLLGIRGILLQPHVLEGLNPLHGAVFLLDHRLAGFLVLGAVFLVVTGAEALYADLGHFGRKPIRFGWFMLVLPALLLNYLGQGALILSDVNAVRNPFFFLAPDWARLPLVVLATLATIIASQAVITGVFSITMQAVQLGYAPRLEMRHTSPSTYGQIYVPPINWMLMVGTILLVLSFGSSSALAAAYGVAIVTAMLVDTILLFSVAPQRWGWNPILARSLLGIFFFIEAAFLGANLVKIQHGGWVPLAIGAGIFIMMTTWQDGRVLVGQRLMQKLVPLDRFLSSLDFQNTIRVPGNAVYMTGNPMFAPPALSMNVEHQKVVHERVILLSVLTEKVPHVRRGNRVSAEELGQNVFRVQARYGFMQTPDISDIFSRLREHNLDLDIQQTTFFLGRERVVPAKGSSIARWRIMLFSFLSRNSQRATAFFNLPPERVVEVGSQLEV